MSEGCEFLIWHDRKAMVQGRMRDFGSPGWHACQAPRFGRTPYCREHARGELLNIRSLLDALAILLEHFGLASEKCAGLRVGPEIDELVAELDKQEEGNV